jgi:hypothetical protein
MKGDVMPSLQQVRASRYTLLISAVICRFGLLAFLQVPPECRFRATILLVVVALFPYALASVLVGRLRSVGAIVGVVVSVMTADVLVTVGALFPGASTDAVGLVTEPIFASAALMLALMFTQRLDRTP